MCKAIRSSSLAEVQKFYAEGAQKVDLEQAESEYSTILVENTAL